MTFESAFMRRSIATAVVLVLSTTFAAGASARPAQKVPAQQPSSALKVASLAAQPYLEPLAVQQFYEARGGLAAWTSDADYDSLLLAIERLADHGLDPREYRMTELTALRGDAIARERIATDAWFSAAGHMMDGKVNPLSVEPNWTAPRRSIDLQARLGEALNGGGVASSLIGLAPRHPSYHRMVDALHQLRIESQLPDATKQSRDTAKKIDQLRVNLERWRWLPDDLGTRHIKANIPEFKLVAVENGEVAREHKIIVGKVLRKTPVFSSAIEYLVLNPWWETPPHLARADKLPVFRKDPGAVRRMGFTVLDREGQRVDPRNINWHEVSPSAFPFRLRQAPGELNALGKIKIMFPNRHNVYLHDTPTRDLFDKTTRLFSSGCMRTENPVELAKWLLQGSGTWEGDALDKAIATGKVQNISLAGKVPVHVLYFTVVDGEEGGVQFLADVYGRDKAVLDRLEAASVASRMPLGRVV